MILLFCLYNQFASVLNVCDLFVIWLASCKRWLFAMQEAISMHVKGGLLWRKWRSFIMRI